MKEPTSTNGSASINTLAKLIPCSLTIRNGSGTQMASMSTHARVTQELWESQLQLFLLLSLCSSSDCTQVITTFQFLTTLNYILSFPIIIYTLSLNSTFY